MNANSKNLKQGRKEREFQLRRNEIIAAAIRLFATNGYHRTTMNEIAKEAEFSTGSLYNFFKNKEELYFTIFKEQLTELEAMLREERSRPGSVSEVLERMVSTILDYFDTNRDFFRIMITHREAFELSIKGEFAEVIHKMYLSFIKEIVYIFQEGIEKGVFKGYQPEELALVFMGVVNSFIFIWGNSEAQYPLTDKREAILDLFYHGVAK